MRMFVRSAGGLILAAFAGLACAQSFPAKPIRIIDGFPAGGGTDVLARIVAPKLMASLGQPVVVENRPGAGSNVGAEIVAKSPPDGHTLFVASSTSITVSATLYPKLPYSLAKDLTPVIALGSGSLVLIAHPALPAKSLKELVALAKARPGQINYGSAGIGSGTHLCVELFKDITGTNLVHVAYKGGAPLQTAMIAGEVQLSCVTLTAALPQINSGRLLGLAVTGPERSPSMPQVPTVAESGFPGAEVTTTFGLLAPAATPKPVIALLNREIRKIVETAEVRDRFAAQGVVAAPGTPEQFGAALNAEVEKWAKVIKSANIRVE